MVDCYVHFTLIILKEEKPVVLYVIDTLATGGAETSLLEIASGLVSLRAVVCVLFSRNADLHGAFQHRGIEVIFLDIKSRLWWLEGTRKLRSVIQQTEPAIVHATLFKSEIITRLVMRNSQIPNIGSFVNDSYADNRYKNQAFVRNIKLTVVRYLDLFTARWATHFMAISQTVANSNAKALRLRAEKITCIYRGRNINDFPVAHPPLTLSPFTFITVARLLKRKGYLELFNAAKELANRGCEFKIIIAGDGADAGFFKQTVSRLGIQHYIVFMGNRSDVPDLLARAHCFVFPSHYEGQGGSLVEAMLAAKPIIATDIPVFREQITEDVTGKLFKVFDSQDLAAKMKWVMEHYEEAVAQGMSARRDAVNRFTIENTVRLHEALYEDVVQRKLMSNIGP